MMYFLKKINTLLVVLFLLATFVFVAEAQTNRGEWAEGNSYAVGDIVTYQGSTYQCLQAHTAFVGAGWTPNTQAALWTLVTSGPTPTVVVPTNTATTAPPTATFTAVPPTATSTNVPATATSTSVPATATSTGAPATATSTGVPATATSTGVPATATSTSVPPTATSTGVPATATSTSVPPTVTPTATGGSTGQCAAAWNSATVYATPGTMVSYNGHNWSNQWWTQNETPGPVGGVWLDKGLCSLFTPTPTSTATNTPIPPTATSTSTPCTTCTPTSTPTATNTPVPVTNRQVVGYFAQWGIYQRGYYVKNIDTSGSAKHLTILNYAFGNIVNGKCIMTTQTGVMDAYADYQKSFDAATSVDGIADKWDQPLKGNFNQLKELKAKYPHLKVVISLGGWTWSGGFSDAALTDASRKQMVSSCIDLYIKGNLPVADGAGGPGAAAGVFDGIDIDWEYPGDPGAGNTYRPEDGHNFTLLLAEFRSQLNAINPNLLLTIAPGAGVDKYSKLELNQIHQYLNYINLMSYDMHGAWDLTATNHNAPLYPSPNDPSPYPSNSYSIDTAVQGYINGGVPANKLNVGLPFYGRGWTGVSAGSTNGLYRPASAAAKGTYEDGFEDYKVLKTLGWPTYYDPIAHVKWLYNGTTFWSFEDPAVLTDKVNYIKSKGLAGAMVWELDGDTTNGELMNAIGTAMGNTTMPTPTPTSVAPTATPTVIIPTATSTVVVTPTATSTPVVTATATSTVVAPTSTATNNPSTATSTPVAPTATATPATVTPTPTSPATGHETCRPDGLYRTTGLDVPYCTVYNVAGRELLVNGLQRRVIGYFTSWRTGKNGQPSYLVSDIPWSKLTHINYAFVHIDSNHRVSIGNPNDPNNAATGLTWPGVAGAEMDPAYSYKGHFNLLSKYKKQYHVKTLISVGGWAETGGYFDDNGNRVNSGGFYSMALNADGSVNQTGINTFADSAVAFIRQYGFDGVDIDWEYPTSMKDAGNPLDWSVANARRANMMKGYVATMKTLREKLDAASVADNHHYLLTTATPSSAYLIRGMETYQTTKYFDFVNIMSYDLHGAWNEFVGPNAALYDDGKDAELAKWNVYSTAEYGGMGYLNTDWAYHYFRGAMSAGRINIGVPYYTRGFKGVTGGTNGLWGKSAVVTNCGPGLTTCGDGARGIDNIWHDLDTNGQEMGAGSNPMWHAKNLENGITGSYLASYGLNPATDLEDQFVGTYVRNYNATLVAPWLWNEQKKVFLSTEDEQSINTKAQYVIDKGIGGVMFWELAGDYKWYPERNNGAGEYYMGSTLTSLISDKFKTASPYGNKISNSAAPAKVVDLTVEMTGFKVGDENYPINPLMKITNNTTGTVPGGSVLEFDVPTSASPIFKSWNGDDVKVISVGHTGANNIGGLTGDFHRIAVTLPSWKTIAPGQSIDVNLVYYLPISGPSNYTLKVNGVTYGLKFEQPNLPTAQLP